MTKIGAPPKPGTMQGFAKGCGVDADAVACVAAEHCGVVELCDAAPMPGPGGKESRTLRSRMIMSGLFRSASSSSPGAQVCKMARAESALNMVQCSSKVRAMRCWDTGAINEFERSRIV